MIWRPCPDYEVKSFVKYVSKMSGFEFRLRRSPDGSTLILYRVNLRESPYLGTVLYKTSTDADEAERLILADMDAFLMEHLL